MSAVDLYAHCEGSLVVEVIPATVLVDGEAIPLAARYPAEFVLGLVPIPAGIQPAPGWTFIADSFEPPTPPSLTADDVRSMRDTLLTQCDWTQLADVPASVRTPWAQYRQALRDVTKQKGFPAAVQWPEAPQS